MFCFVIYPISTATFMTKSKRKEGFHQTGLPPSLDIEALQKRVVHGWFIFNLFEIFIRQVEKANRLLFVQFEKCKINTNCSWNLKIILVPDFCYCLFFLIKISIIITKSLFALFRFSCESAILITIFKWYSFSNRAGFQSEQMKCFMVILIKWNLSMSWSNFLD